MQAWHPYVEPVLGKTAALVDPKSAAAARTMVENCILKVFMERQRSVVVLENTMRLRNVFGSDDSCGKRYFWVAGSFYINTSPPNAWLFHLR
jgi:hypothetical protein